MDILETSNSEINTDESVKVPHRWRSAITLIFARIIDSTESGVLQGLFPVIRDALGLSLANLGQISSINRIVNVIVGPLWGMLADRFDRKKILVFVTGVWGLWTLAAGFAQNYTQMVILLVIAALGTAAGGPIVNAFLADLFSDDERGKAMGIIGGVTAAFFIVTNPLFAQLSRIPDGWRIGFYIAGGLSVISGMIIWLFLVDPGRGASEKEIADLAKEDSTGESKLQFKFSDLRELLHIPSFIHLSIMGSLSISVAIFSFLVVYFTDARGLETYQAGILYVPFLMGIIVTNIAGGFVGDKIHKRNPRIGRLRAYHVVQFLGIVVSFLAFQIDWGGMAMMAIMLFIFGAITGFTIPLQNPLVPAIVPPELRATASAIGQTVVGSIAVVLGNLLMGYLGDRFGMEQAFLYVITLSGIIPLLYTFVLYRTFPRDVDRLHKQLSEKRDELMSD